MCALWIFAINVFSSFRHYLSELVTLRVMAGITAVVFVVMIVARYEDFIIRIKVKDLPWCSIVYTIFVTYVYSSQNWATEYIGATDIIPTLRENVLIIFCLEMFFGFGGYGKKIPVVYVIANLLFGFVVTFTTPIANWGSAKQYGGITSVNRNTASYVFVIGFGMCLYLAEKYGKYLYGAAALFVAFALVTGSRKGIIEIALTIAVFLILKDDLKDKVRITVLLVVLGIFGLVLFLNIPFLRETYGERLLAIFDDSIEDSSRDNRTLLRLNAFSAFLKRPWFGNGAGYAAVTNKAKIGINAYSHCNYIELLCNYGIVGFFLYYIAYIHMIVKALLHRMDLYAKMTLTCLIPLIVIEYGQVTYYIKVGAVPIIMLFLTARYAIGQDEKEENIATVP